MRGCVGIFDADTHFEECKNMGMRMHRLKPASTGAKRVLDMLEVGVADALSLGYLRSLSFVLTNKGNTVEEYRFNVRYGARGEVSVDAPQRIDEKGNATMSETTGKSTRAGRLADVDYIKKSAIAMTRCLISLVKTLEEVPKGCSFSIHINYVNGTPVDYEPPFFAAAGKSTRAGRLADVDYIKKSAIAMTRCLISLVKTLEEVPKGCSFSIHINYVNGTPVDYEPPFFAAADGDAEANWSKKNPFSMSVGRVETEHHGLSLRVRSTLDPAQDTDSGDKGDHSSSQTSSILEGTPSTPEPEKAPVDAPQELANVNLSQPMNPIADHDDVENDVMDDLVLKWITEQRAGAFTDVVACAKQMRRYQFRSIQAAFERLESRKVIFCKEDGSYRRSVAPKAKSQKRPRKPPSGIGTRLRSAKKMK